MPGPRRLEPSPEHTPCRPHLRHLRHQVAGSKLWRSRVCPKTLHPAWHQTHRFQGYLRDLGSEPLCVRVYDRDRLSMNDFMGKCQVSLENLEMNSTLEFKDIPLEGVSTGRVSFSARFELTPVFSLFPGTPLHASAAQARPPCHAHHAMPTARTLGAVLTALHTWYTHLPCLPWLGLALAYHALHAPQALRRRPPASASRAELARDTVLRALAHRYWAYAAVLWLTTLVSWIVWIVLLHIGIVGPPLFEGGEPVDARWWPLFWKDSDLHFWANICFHWTTGLGTYLNTITLAWRVSIGLHLWAGGFCSGRSSEPGEDFYGRPTEAIWFHIPRRPRGQITFCLLASTFFHYMMQVFRLVYYDYEGLTGPAGSVLVNLPFGLSVVLGIVGGAIQVSINAASAPAPTPNPALTLTPPLTPSLTPTPTPTPAPAPAPAPTLTIVQGGAEKKLMKDSPEKWPPGVGELVKDALRAMRKGELTLSMLGGWLNARKLESAVAKLMKDTASGVTSGVTSLTDAVGLTDAAKDGGKDGYALGDGEELPAAS